MHARSSKPGSGPRGVAAWRAWAVGLVLAGLWLPAHADALWQFVDRDGVVHMGNVAAPQAPAGRELIWLSLPPGTARDAPAARKARALHELPGYAAAKPHLEAAALAQAVEPALVIAVAAAESAFNPQAVSRKGALGLMQLMPATAQRYGAPPSADGAAVMEPKLNAELGSRYLADLLRLFGGDKELAVAAYNAGEGAVLKHGRRIPPYPETQQYVERVMRLYRGLVR